MFINFWYPALTSVELVNEPVRVRMLGLDFVLARDAKGRPSCRSDVSGHPRPSGQERRLVDSYPVEERYGIVFVFLGDLPEAERPGIMPIPEYGQDGWRLNLMTFDARVNFERSVENALDPAHTSFVHGFGAMGEQRQLELQSFEWGALFMTEFYNTPGLPPDFVPSAGTGFHGASQFYTLISAPPDIQTNQFMYELPVDEQHIRIFLVSTRNKYIEPVHDAVTIKACTKVVREDLRVLEDLRPVLTPRQGGREFLVAADGPIVNYRNWLEAWEERGWRIDSARLRAGGGGANAAIPSPERRAGGDWLLEPVPLMAAGRNA